MFTGKRFTTKGIVEEIPYCIQNVMWAMIENMQVDKKDYLQVFKLEKGYDDSKVLVQKLIHCQEQPEYKKIITVPICQDKVLETKVYVIDDGDYATMLLADEY